MRLHGLHNHVAVDIIDHPVGHQVVYSLQIGVKSSHTWRGHGGGCVPGKAAHVHFINDQVLKGQVQRLVALPIEGCARCRQHARSLRPCARQPQCTPRSVLHILLCIGFASSCLQLTSYTQRAPTKMVNYQTQLEHGQEGDQYRTGPSCPKTLRPMIAVA